MLSYFKTISGINILLEYESNITIKELKDLLSKKMKVPANELHIIFCGKTCQDNKIADDYKFWKENGAHVIHRKKIN
mgnify:CR=1 FL=1